VIAFVTALAHGQALWFSGNPGVDIPAGVREISYPVDLPVPNCADLVVSQQSTGESQIIRSKIFPCRLSITLIDFIIDTGPSISKNTFVTRLNLLRFFVTHVFNSWEAMPSVDEQMSLASSHTNPELCAARFLLNPIFIRVDKTEVSA